jgi:hypothetical protein
MLKAFFRGLAIFFVSVVVVAALAVGGLSAWLWYASRSDPYPAFMANFDSDVPGPPYTYADAQEAFTRFISKKFPIGSNAKRVIEEVTRESFQLLPTTRQEMVLGWKRHAGLVCAEYFSITVKSDDDVLITSIRGELRPACL